MSPVPPFQDGRPPQLLLSVSGFLFAARNPNHALALDLVADFLTRPDVTRALAEKMVAIPAAAHFSTRDPLLTALAELCVQARPMPAAPEMRMVWRLLGRAQAQIIGGADVQRTADQLAADLTGLVAEPPG